MSDFVTRSLAGAAAGLAATGPMTLFMEAGRPLLHPCNYRPLPPRRVTERAAASVDAHDDMNEPQKKAATGVAHFAYGCRGRGRVRGAIAPVAHEPGVEWRGLRPRRVGRQLPGAYAGPRPAPARHPRAGRPERPDDRCRHRLGGHARPTHRSDGRSERTPAAGGRTRSPAPDAGEPGVDFGPTLKAHVTRIVRLLGGARWRAVRNGRAPRPSTPAACVSRTRGRCPPATRGPMARPRSLSRRACRPGSRPEVHRPGVAPVHGQEPAGFHVPQGRRLVLRPGQQPGPVGGISQGRHPGLVSGEQADRGPSLDVHHLHRPVLRHASRFESGLKANKCSGERPGQRPVAGGIRPAKAPGGCVPEPDESVRRPPADDDSAVRAELHLLPLGPAGHSPWALPGPIRGSPGLSPAARCGRRTGPARRTVRSGRRPSPRPG